MNLKITYLFLSITGALVPYYFFIRFLLDNGLNFELFISQLFSNNISTFFAVDVLISAIVLIIYILLDAKNLKIKYYFIPIFGTLCIGVSFGLPFYLYLKESQKNNSQTAPTKS